MEVLEYYYISVMSRCTTLVPCIGSGLLRRCHDSVEYKKQKLCSIIVAMFLYSRLEAAPQCQHGFAMQVVSTADSS